MFAPFVYAASVALLSLRSFVYASPLVARGGQTVWNPPITAPRAGDVWTVGSTQLVTWNTDEIPPSAASNVGTLLLGYFDGDTPGENLDTYHPLAEGFFLTDGCVSVQVPDVKPRDSYIVVLMGNSGNASPEFSITSTAKHGKSYKTFDKAISQKSPEGVGSKKFPPGFVPVSPAPQPHGPLVPAPKTEPIDTEPFSDGAPASTLCKERASSFRDGSSLSSAHDNLASSEGRNKPC